MTTESEPDIDIEIEEEQIKNKTEDKDSIDGIDLEKFKNILRDFIERDTYGIFKLKSKKLLDKKINLSNDKIEKLLDLKKRSNDQIEKETEKLAELEEKNFDTVNKLLAQLEIDDI